MRIHAVLGSDVKKINKLIKICILTQDLEVNVAFGKDIVLKNVKLKESALREAGVPLK